MRGAAAECSLANRVVDTWRTTPSEPLGGCLRAWGWWVRSIPPQDHRRLGALSAARSLRALDRFLGLTPPPASALSARNLSIRACFDATSQEPPNSPPARGLLRASARRSGGCSGMRVSP